jgi:hypothetical protein
MGMSASIRIELETVGDPRSTFRLQIGDKVVDANLTAMQAHLLVGEILERIVLREAVAARDPTSPAEREAPRFRNYPTRKPSASREKAAA